MSNSVERREILMIAGGMMLEGVTKEDVVGYLALMGYDPADIEWWCNTTLIEDQYQDKNNC